MKHCFKEYQCINFVLYNPGDSSSKIRDLKWIMLFHGHGLFPSSSGKRWRKFQTFLNIHTPLILSEKSAATVPLSSCLVLWQWYCGGGSIMLWVRLSEMALGTFWGRRKNRLIEILKINLCIDPKNSLKIMGEKHYNWKNLGCYKNNLQAVTIATSWRVTR